MPRARQFRKNDSRLFCVLCQRKVEDGIAIPNMPEHFACADCLSNLYAEWHPRRAMQRRHAYGVDEAYQAKLLIRQKGKCAICGGSGPLCLDHDHTTNKVRGFLCDPCNKGLGFFRDDINRLRQAEVYLLSADPLGEIPRRRPRPVIVGTPEDRARHIAERFEKRRKRRQSS